MRTEPVLLLRTASVCLVGKLASGRHEDIEQVLQAVHEYSVFPPDKVELVKNMVNNESSGEDIARVLRAMRGPGGVPPVTTAPPQVTV